LLLSSRANRIGFYCYVIRKQENKKKQNGKCIFYSFLFFDAWGLVFGLAFDWGCFFYFGLRALVAASPDAAAALFLFL